MIQIDRDGRAAVQARESVSETLISLDRGRHLAMLYRPKTAGRRSGVAVVLMHCDQNYMTLGMGPALAEKGFTVLAADAWIGGEIDRKIEHLGRLVWFLRQQPGIPRVVLMGYSGGATLMTAYQAIAEKGVDVFRGEEMIYKCTVKGELSPADGLMLIDANYGNGVMSLVSLDPAVIQEGNGMRLDPRWDIFDPENGYDPAGAKYSPEFIKSYQSAQSARNMRLIDAALRRLEKLERGEGDFADDEPFLIAAADQPKPNNRLLPEDPRLLSHTQGEYDLYHGDGSMTRERIRCVRVAECDHSMSRQYAGGANPNTVRGFLSSQTLRTTPDFAVTEDDVLGVDWHSSYASPIGNIRHIAAPSLFIGLTGSYEYLASEMIYRHAGMADKTIAFVHGADHMFAPNRRAEKVPGEFGDTESVLYEAMASWMDRFAR